MVGLPLRRLRVLRGPGPSRHDAGNLAAGAEAQAETFERLGQIATAASPLVLRFDPSSASLVRTWQWWARSLLLTDPSESVSLLVRAAESCLAEDRPGACLHVILDMVWPLVLEGIPATDLIEQDPLARLHGDRRTANISSGNRP